MDLQTLVAAWVLRGWAELPMPFAPMPQGLGDLGIQIFWSGELRTDTQTLQLLFESLQQGYPVARPGARL